MKITNEIVEALGHYVYIYVDPRNGRPFYIGKGQGGRVLDHLHDIRDTEKISTIRAIRDAGVEPIIDILRYGLTKNEADLVEAAAIDLIGISRLSNKVAGYHSRSFGRIALKEFVQIHSAKPVVVRHQAILITINVLYRSDMSDKELYEATRGVWRIGPRRGKAEFGMAVYRGVVREVYKIKEWHPAGTLTYETRNAEDVNLSGRWEFEGSVAEDIRDEYVGYSVGPSGQNPIRYKNIP